MIARVWRARLDPAQLVLYRHFEQTQCLPMLRRQPGFLGSLFLREAPDRTISLTLWEDNGAVEALKSSPSYQETVLALVEGGFLRGEPTVEGWEVRSGELRVEALLRMLDKLSSSS